MATWLESVAARARALTVDRAQRVVRVLVLGVLAATFAVMATVFLFLTAYQALEIPLRPWGAYGVLAGLFALGGGFMWGKRDRS